MNILVQPCFGWPRLPGRLAGCRACGVSRIRPPVGRAPRGSRKTDTLAAQPLPARPLGRGAGKPATCEDMGLEQRLVRRCQSASRPNSDASSTEEPRTYRRLRVSGPEAPRRTGHRKSACGAAGTSWPRRRTGRRRASHVLSCACAGGIPTGGDLPAKTHGVGGDGRDGRPPRGIVATPLRP